MSSMFDFIRKYDNAAFICGKNMENTLCEQPVSALTFGGRFIEAIRNALYMYHYKDIIKSNVNISDINEDSISFRKEDLSKHISDLFHQNLINRAFYTKILSAYQIRHKIHLHNDIDDIEVDKNAAYKLYKEVFEIGLMFCEHVDNQFDKNDYEFKWPIEDKNLSNTPDVKLAKIFDNCIVCGKPNTSPNRNLCPDCKRKIRIANDLEDLIEILDSRIFNEQFLKDNSYDKYEIDYLIHFLREFNLVIRESNGDFYLKDLDKLYDFIEETESYELAEKVLIAFYNGKIKSEDLDYNEDSPYKLGESGKLFNEYYNLIVDKKVKHYLKYKTLNIYLTLDMTNVTLEEINNWYLLKLLAIKEANYKIGKDISFDKMSAILTDKWLEYRKQGLSKAEIQSKLKLDDKIIDFWFDNRDRVIKNYPFVKKFIDNNRTIVMKLFVDAIADGLSKEEAMAVADINDEFYNKNFNLLNGDAILLQYGVLSQSKNKGQFNRFKEIYFDEKSTKFIKSLKGNTLQYALKEADLPLEEFNEWYDYGKKEYSKPKTSDDIKNEFINFYFDVTKIFLENWLDQRRVGIKKNQAFEEIGLDPKYLNEWFNAKEFNFKNSKFGEFIEIEDELFNDFYMEHDKIIIDLVAEAIEKGCNKEKIAKYADVSVDLIDCLSKLGSEGKEEYLGLYTKFEEIYLPKRREEFIDYFRSHGDFEKSIKVSDLSKDYVDTIYELGKNGDEDHIDFYEEFLKAKLKTYSFLTICKTKEKRKLELANIRSEDVEKYSNEIDALILLTKMTLFLIKMSKNSKIDKVVNDLNITKKTTYDWFLKGKELISYDEYMNSDELEEKKIGNMFLYITKHEDYKFNAHDSYDEFYKLFYNLYFEFCVKAKCEFISEHITGNSKEFRNVLKSCYTSKSEFKFWDELGFIERPEIDLTSDE